MAVKINHKQSRFIGEYMIDLNATQAAIRAGYSANCARVTSCNLLAKANIKHEIERRQAVLSQKAGYKQQDSIDRLTRYADGAEENKQYASAVSSVVAINRMFGWDKDNNASDRVQIVINPPNNPKRVESETIDNE